MKDFLFVVLFIGVAVFAFYRYAPPAAPVPPVPPAAPVPPTSPVPPA